MNQENVDPEKGLPLQLQLCLLESELERIEADLARLEDRRDEILGQIHHYESKLIKVQRRTLLRRVK
jgi:hypothetical protein